MQKRINNPNNILNKCFNALLIQPLGENSIYQQRSIEWNEYCNHFDCLDRINVIVPLLALENGISMEEVFKFTNMLGLISPSERNALALFSKRGPEYFQYLNEQLTTKIEFEHPLANKDTCYKQRTLKDVIDQNAVFSKNQELER